MPLRLTTALLLSLLLVPAARAADAANPGDIVVDKEKRTVTLPAKVAPRVLPKYAPKVYPIEVVATWPHDRKPVEGQKAHETIVTFDVNPSDVHKAIESLGLKPGKPAVGEGAAAQGPEVKLFLDLPGEAGAASKRVSLLDCLIETKTKKPLKTLKFLFTGSVMTQPSPDKDEKVYGADLTGTLIALFPVTNQTVIQTNLTMKDEPLLKLETNKKVLPAEGTAVKLVIEVAAK